MRWDDLFDDLEAQITVLSAQERAGEVAELARAEFARVSLADRIRPSLGAEVGLRCRGELRIAGRLDAIGPDWLLISEPTGREALVRSHAVMQIDGLVRLTAGADSAGPVARRLGLSSALRGIARDRSAVRIHLVDGSVLTGTIDRVGVDFLELAAHPGAETRRRDQVRTILVVPQPAISVVRRGA